MEKITAEVERVAGDAQTGIGTGGMRSKIMTAKKVGAIGVPMAIVNGRRNGILLALFEGREAGTLFLPTPGETGEPEALDSIYGLHQRQARCG